MRKLSLVFLGLFVSGCEQSVPPLDLKCVRGDQEITFRSDSETNTIIGSDGTSTNFYEDNFMEVVFVNFDDWGKPTRVLNFYPTDPGVEIIEDGVSQSWMCSYLDT